MENLIIVSVKSYVIDTDVLGIIFQFTGLKLSSEDARKQRKSRSSEIICSQHKTFHTTCHCLNKPASQRSFNFSNFREEFSVTKMYLKGLFST